MVLNGSVNCLVSPPPPLGFWGTEEGNMTVYFKENNGFLGD